MPAPRVFSIPPGAPFLASFAQALRDGAILPGLADPLALARATIYVPTRRAARALAHELAVAFGGSALLLPRIRPLGALEEAGGLLPGMEATGLEGAAAMGEIERRMLLTRQILAWGRALPHAIVSIGADGEAEMDPSEALLVANTAAGAWHLSGALAGLIDELIIEDVAWEKLEDLGGDFDAYWRITLDFLDIAIRNWPALLAARGQVDGARRLVAFAEQQIKALESGLEQNHVIAIGSTGTNRAVARLLASIAGFPRGAVVLPGLDFELDDAAFALVGAVDASGMSHASSHPQAALRRLLPVLGISRAGIVPLGAVPPALAARARFVSAALRPADATDSWGAWLASTPASERALALAGVTLIEAGDEREEALSLAICLREALETPGATAALVTPDRDLAARVKAELLRWAIDIDDSGGDPLGASPLGALARLVLACAASRRAALDVIALLGHPLTCLGRPRAEVERLSPLVEIGILRAVLPDVAQEDLVEAARAAAGERFAHPAVKLIADEDWDGIEALLQALDGALDPLLAIGGEAALGTWIAAHRQALALLQAGAPAAPPGEDAELLGEMFDELEAAALPDIRFDCEGYAAFFDRLAQEAVLRGPRRAHPRLKILGLLEARLLQADVMLLGGLDETIWPPLAASDPFLNRPMRARLGLTTPERRVGQTAHDFSQAMGNAKVVLSRARKRGGKPMVASRLLQRLATLGVDDWRACAQRGDAVLALSRAIDQPRSTRNLQRPEPRPAIALRPTRLSVTRIETLRRDPYSIHAEHILKLIPLDPLGIETGAREMGLLMHEALAAFARKHPSGPVGPGALEELVAMAREKMAPLLANASFRAFQWPRVETALAYFIDFELARRGGIARILAEEHGEMRIDLDDGSRFTLTADADRLEVNRDGTVTLVDYKTGAAPGTEEVRVGFAPQLTLEATMVNAGAFANLPAGAFSREALYLKLGGKDGGKVTKLKFKEHEFEAVVADHWTGLEALLNQFRRIETPYIPRPYPKFAARFNSYDHLSRLAEWAAGQEEG